MAEGGILKRVRDKWYRREEDPERTPHPSIDMRQAAPVFWWNVVGILVSLLVLIAELCVFRFTKRILPANKTMYLRGQARLEFMN
jgi:hypothetical protein